MGPDPGQAGRRCCKRVLAAPHLWVEYNLQSVKTVLQKSLLVQLLMTGLLFTQPGSGLHPLYTGNRRLAGYHGNSIPRPLIAPY